MLISTLVLPSLATASAARYRREYTIVTNISSPLYVTVDDWEHCLQRGLGAEPLIKGSGGVKPLDQS